MVVILQLVMLLHNFDDSFVQVIRTNLRPELTAMWFWTIAQLICLTYVNYTLAQTQDVNLTFKHNPDVDLVIGPDRRMWIWEMMWIWILWLKGPIQHWEDQKIKSSQICLQLKGYGDGDGRNLPLKYFGLKCLTFWENINQILKK